MEQTNILNEISELLNSTNENLKFVISRSATNYVVLLKSICTTLTNVEKILKRESSVRDKERNAFIDAYTDVILFMTKKGCMKEYEEYCNKKRL